VTGGRPAAPTPPVAGGLDLDLPGRGVRLRGTRWPGSGAPVLLLHGLASTRRFWDLVVPGLAGLPVLALDQRGHGESERPPGPYDGEAVVADLLTALDAVGLSRVVVVGHSWGAWTALRLAAHAPSRVLAAVALDGGVYRLGQIAPTLGQAREQLTPPRLALAPEQVAGYLRTGPLERWWSPAVEAALLPSLAVGQDGLARPRLPFEAHMQIVDDLLDADPDAVLPRVACPTWLVGCTPDAAQAAALDHAERTLPAARVLLWRGAVHDVPLQWPALVAGLVRAAAEEVSRAPAGEGEPA
jgi:pimeloyl-ACP methyl ester carboxylesterase